MQNFNLKTDEQTNKKTGLVRCVFAAKMTFLGMFSSVQQGHGWLYHCRRNEVRINKCNNSKENNIFWQNYKLSRFVLMHLPGEITYKEIDQMITTVDKNEDWKISYSEFRVSQIIPSLIFYQYHINPISVYLVFPLLKKSPEQVLSQPMLSSCQKTLEILNNIRLCRLPFTSSLPTYL